MREQEAGESLKLLISIVVPCYNESDVFPVLRKELVSLAERWASKYQTEFVLIDDGSRDDTWMQMQQFAAEDPRVVAVSLSRNFGHQSALTCGYDFAEGDAVVSLDADLQDPPEVIPDLVQAWENGADIVYAVRAHREDSYFKKLTAQLFYRIFLALTETSAPLNTGDFRLMNRQSLEAFKKLREQHRYIRGMIGWLGFRTAEIEYERKPRRLGYSKYPFHKMLAFALNAIVSFSIFPLRLAYFSAIFASLSIFGYITYVLVTHFLFGALLVPGWSSVLACITIFGFLNLFCLGIMGEYIGRLYEESKQRPLYLIYKTKESAKDLP